MFGTPSPDVQITTISGQKKPFSDFMVLPLVGVMFGLEVKVSDRFDLY